MDWKTRLLRFGCVVASLEVAVMAASLITATIATPNDSPDVYSASPLVYSASLWLMLFHNVLEICFYGVLASLLATDNRPFAIAGFVSGLIGLLALSCSILIEIKSSLGPSFPFYFQEPFGFGYGAIDALCGIIGSFSILPANGFFALAALRHPQRRPAVPVILFVGIPVGMISLFIPEQATGWLQFLGDWLVPIFVVCKQLILLWWFVTLLQPVPSIKQSVRSLVGDLPQSDGLLPEPMKILATGDGLRRTRH
jgi:hypothetical protein